MSLSRLRRSPSPQTPHHAWVAYRMDETVELLRLELCTVVIKITWVRRSLNANIEEEQVFKTCEPWSVMESLALSRTPRTLGVVGLTLSTPSMKSCEGGCTDLDLAPVTTT